MKRNLLKRAGIFISSVMLVTSVNLTVAMGLSESYAEKTFTTTTDFNQGTYANVVNTTPDELKLDETTKPFNFIWVAVSTKGTIVKIDTDSGAIVGEYLAVPSGVGSDPSRTTVDKNGSVWVANRAGNSVTRICTPESGLWVDRNGNGVCDTSVGQGDIKEWTNAGGADTNGGTSTAKDECIINYVRVSSYGTRHVSVDKNNDVWVSGTGNRKFDLIDGVTGLIKRTEGPVGYGGYGGLIDNNGVIWSASPFLRWDTALPLSGSNGVNWLGNGYSSYGLALDPFGNVWNSTYGEGVIRKYAPNGTLIGTYKEGNWYAQGCVADENGDIWIAHSLSGSTVGHLKNDGSYVGTIPVGSGPTGVSIDSKGKIWVTNYSSRTVSRIDPNAGPLGPDGVTRVGAVDFTTVNLGGSPYNYSDMTGSSLQGAPKMGSWSVVYDSQIAGAKWGKIDWNSLITGDGDINVSVSSSEDGITFGSVSNVINGTVANVPNGRYLKVTANFKRATTGESPVLYELTARTNQAPELALIGNKTVLETKTIQFELNATDPEGDVLTFSASNLPEGATFDPATRIFSWTPTNAQIGTYPAVHFEVNDGNQPDSGDITIDVLKANTPPDTSKVYPSIANLWPPNHKFVDINILGVTDADGDDVSIEIVKITSDEATTAVSSGGETHSPDAAGIGTSTVSIRAERAGNGNGRVYEITFVATDSYDKTYGSVKVSVPVSVKGAAINDGQNFDATMAN